MTRAMMISDIGLDRVRSEQARTLYRNCPVGVISAGTGAVLMAVAFAQAGRTSVFNAALWSGLMVGCVALHLGLCIAYWHAAPPDRAWRRWLNLFTLVAFLEGLTWLLGAILMTSPTDLTQELIVLLVSTAISSGAVSVFGTYLPTYIVFFFPAMIPHLGFGMVHRYPHHQLLAALVLAYLVAMTLIAWRANGQLTEGLRLRFENIDLLEDVRLQKEIAEQANMAKSSFLAAASHDLRQPVHALSMFVGALRSRRMDKVARGLVDHIDQSVTAMDGLFASLLDISKLDAGVITPRIEPVAIRPLLERLHREISAQAEDKGVILKLVPSSAVVESDPVLLERILRNLLSNAVRYTNAGRIVLGCRRKAETLSIEVWDTGMGISPANQVRIFEEFYQVANSERDRSKGLGLGLAIVRRVAVLLGAALSFDSELGRGSVFRLAVRRVEGLVSAIGETGRARLVITTGHILVIDDEVQIQQAMAALLTSWGYRVQAAGALAEVDLRAGAPIPALLICDYRLRGEENGVDLIRALRSHYATDIPAMLITGDTAPDRMADAQASGFLLLHKPLANAKLRAAIGNMLRATL